ncbi:hypothetical protein [Virgisporangium aurantiacum]|uniref:Uncharacterized protein n=1 Tax=Virgisporangium aurantiacum TaxID=175570 RepID=A0A8J4E705_9ACTN|nr:hypothetical protein [Virgisporangium aurantiacum]GIJ64630.1 hypothetical protein Vau01_121460 [Virgisporangium aurantiacum]
MTKRSQAILGTISVGVALFLGVIAAGGTRVAPAGDLAPAANHTFQEPDPGDPSPTEPAPPPLPVGPGCPNCYGSGG